MKPWPKDRQPSIALLTPYTGGNLGDAAIQDAVIANIREHLPNARVCLVSELPSVTTRLHGVPSFPISQSTPMQDEPSPAVATKDSDVGGASTTPPASLFGRLKASVKSSRHLYSFMKPVYDGARTARQELRHAWTVYRFLRGVQLLVASGGGQLDEYWGGPWQHPYALFKWGLIAKLAGTRFVLLSVGTCELESKLSVFFIRGALRLASYRSYRDHTSKELLKDLSLTHGDEVYPDLAFSYSNEQMSESMNRESSGKVVGVSPIAYLYSQGWPEQDRVVYERYFGKLTAFISSLLEGGHSVILFSSDGLDRHVVNDAVDVLMKDVDPDVAARLSHPPTDTLAELSDQLGKVDYVVASRLHGVLLSHRFCLPVLAISYDRKVDTYMGDVGMSDYCVDIHGIEPDSLAEVFNKLVAESSSVKSRLREVNDRYARDLERQYGDVLDPIDRMTR